MARSTTHRTPTEAGKLTAVERLLDDPDLTQPLDVPGRPTGNGTPTAASADGAGGQADPTHATVSAFEPAVAAVAAPPSPSVERTGTGRSTSLEQAADRRLVAEAAVLARLAEQDRFDDLVGADATRIRQLNGLLHEAISGREHEGARQLVPADLIGRLRAEAASWAADRGMNGNKTP